MDETFGHIETNLYKFLDRNILASIIDDLTIGVTVTDPNKEDNPLVYINKGFTKITGYQADEVLGRNCRLLQGKQTDQHTVAEIRNHIKEEKPIVTEILNNRKDGKLFWNEINIYPVYNNQKKLVYFVGIQKDITKKKMAEKVNEHNIDLSKKIQEGILSKPIDNNEVSIHGIYKPCHDLGGDLYYWRKIDEHCYSVFLMDVMGHGVSSSLVGMVIRTLIAEVVGLIPDPKKIMEKLNEQMKQFFSGVDETLYFTGIYLLINTKTKEIKYVNAGHPVGIVIGEDKQFSELSRGSIPIGILDHIDVEVGQLTYKENSRILLYTDGLVDDIDGSYLKNVEDIYSYCLKNLALPNAEFVRNVVKLRENDLHTCDDITAISIHLK